MPITNYTELQTALLDELRRPDLSAKAPDWISRAEAVINRRVRLREAEQLSTADYDPINNDRRLSLPTNFRELFGLQIKVKTADDITYETVGRKSADEIEKEYNDAAGKPEWYALRDQLEFNRLPDVIYRVRMYYRRLKWDIAADTTNWLLTNHEDVYFFGAMVHAKAYVHDYQASAWWEGHFNTYLEESELEDEQSRDDEELTFDDALGYDHAGRYDINAG